MSIVVRDIHDVLPCVHNRAGRLRDKVVAAVELCQHEHFVLSVVHTEDSLTAADRG